MHNLDADLSWAGSAVPPALCCSSRLMQQTGELVWPPRACRALSSMHSLMIADARVGPRRRMAPGARPWVLIGLVHSWHEAGVAQLECVQGCR